MLRHGSHTLLSRLFEILIIHSIFFTLVNSTQLNCTGNKEICPQVCNEPPGGLQYSSTFCDTHSGSCVCDCRNALKDECTKTPFTPCFQDCVRKNPNPEAYLYTGGNCPRNTYRDFQCACECRLRDDYYETNDVY